MRFITLADVTDQTVVIVPRNSGQIIRLGATEVVTEALAPARVYGTGTVEISEGYWDDCTIVAGEYAGPPFNGGSGGVEFAGGMKGTEWDGGPWESTSSTFTPPDTVSVDLLRSVDAGLTWETVQLGLSPSTNMEDPEALSNGPTTYRAITYADTGASAYADITVQADSPALWLGGGDGYETVARLPFDPSVKVDASRQRSVQRYDGRSRGVAYAGEQLTRTVDASGTILEGDAENTTVDVMQQLAEADAPLHLYRDPDGRRIYGVIGGISLPRNFDGVWGWSFQLEETDH